MQKTTLSLAALAAYAFLAGCSAGSQSVTSIPAAGASQSAERAVQANLAHSGVAPAFFNVIRSLRPAPVRVQPAKAPAELFVGDMTTNEVDVFANKTWTPAGPITGGIDGPDGAFSDRSGRLFVTNYISDDIAEFAPGATAPDFTYNAGMIDPVDVAVDRGGRVYEADLDLANGAGFVNEYPSGVNKVLRSCSPGGDVDGVAVDASGDVFISVEYTNATANIIEYAGGLNGCHATTLAIPILFAGGLAIDGQGNLLAVDQTSPAVDVIAPPYASITRTLGSGYVDPFRIKINKRNNQVYVTDFGNTEVRILNYPSGSDAATLGSAQGLVAPTGVVDGQNFVP